MERDSSQTIAATQFVQTSERLADTKEFTRILDQKNMMNGFSKGSGESWVTRSPRVFRGKSLSHQGSPGGTTPLTHIYSPPSQPMPLSSEGIVVQALHVVSDQAATNLLSSPEPILKKISKRRRKANGGVDVEHTKSNNELLRKLQLALRQDSQGESDEEPLEASPPDHMARMNTFLQHTVRGSLESKQERQGDEESITSKTTISTVTSDATNRSFSRRSYQTQKENTGTVENNLYGYEDPEKVIAPIQVRRIPRVARRRGSVTEHTIRAAQRAVALDAAERAREMNTSLTSLNLGSDTMAAAATTQRFKSMNVSPKRTQKPLFEKADNNNEQVPLQEVEQSTRYSRKPVSTAVMVASQVALPSYTRQERTGKTMPYHSSVYEDFIVPTFGNSRGYERYSNPYGYESQETMSRESKSTVENVGDESVPITSTNNPYGYGDTAPQVQRRTRPRARRRGSVTKYSLDAAKIAVSSLDKLGDDDDTMQQQMSSTEYKPVLPPANLQPDARSSPISEFKAPQQPVRKTSPWQAHSSPFMARKSALARQSKTLGPPMVHVPSKAESYRSIPSGDAPSQSSDDEDNNDDDNRSISSTSSDGSLDDSVTSITIPLKCGDHQRDLPMRPPSRHDSLQSFASRGSTHSARTFDSSDGDSLAPDMISLCSISQREQRKLGVDNAESVPPPPLFLPQTPTPGVQCRKLHFSNMQSTQTSAHQFLGDGSLLAFDDASPLPSPQTQQLRAIYIGKPSFQGELVYQPELPTSTTME